MYYGTQSPQQLIGTLRERLGARAAGWWRVNDDTLRLVSFAAADDLPGPAATAFVAATLEVGTHQTELAIALAASTRRAAIMTTDASAPDSASGHWLSQFGAKRSIAVPFEDAFGSVVRVVSVALPEDTPGEKAIIDTIRSQVAGWDQAS